MTPMTLLQKKIGPFGLIKEIGNGTLGETWVARKDNTMADCMVKIIPVSKQSEEALLLEAKYWLDLGIHPNILPIAEVTAVDAKIIVVLEATPATTLERWLKINHGKSPSIKTAVQIVSDILKGLEHLHTNGILHADLKPSNVLLDGLVPRLTDYGIVHVLKPDVSTLKLPHLWYASPEALRGRFTRKADLWAAAVLLYQMLAGRLPFPHTEPEEVRWAIATQIPDPLPMVVPQSLHEFLEKALSVEMGNFFPTAAEMRAELLKCFWGLQTTEDKTTSPKMADIPALAPVRETAPDPAAKPHITEPFSSAAVLPFEKVVEVEAEITAKVPVQSTTVPLVRAVVTEPLATGTEALSAGTEPLHGTTEHLPEGGTENLLPGTSSLTASTEPLHTLTGHLPKSSETVKTPVVEPTQPVPAQEGPPSVPGFGAGSAFSTYAEPQPRRLGFLLLPVALILLVVGGVAGFLWWRSTRPAPAVAKQPPVVAKTLPPAPKPVEPNPAPTSTSPSPSPPVATTGPKTVVAKDGSGQFRSINEALAQAQPGAVIVIKPGTYEENLVLNKQVTIQGEGNRDDIVITNHSGAVLEMATEKAEIRGVTLDGAAGSSRRQAFTVFLAKGQLLLDQCTISSDSQACVAIQGPGTNPTLRRCLIFDGSSSGIGMWDRSKATIEDCEIKGNQFAGIVITKGASPTIKNCKINANRLQGIKVGEGGSANVENCDLSNNRKGAWAIDPGCQVTKNGNRE
ncbi:MAG: protein kinase [Blastocatellia bacterium]|nr:protein kinase [Blastocatellia bacterium]